MMQQTTRIIGGPVLFKGVKVMDTNLNDSRRHIRQRVTACAWLEFSQETLPRATTTLDLAIEGARFSSMKPATLGDPVLVRLQLGTSPRYIECKGKVCWTDRMPNRLYNFGVRFVDLYEDERLRLEQFLSGNTLCNAVGVV